MREPLKLYVAMKQIDSIRLEKAAADRPLNAFYRFDIDARRAFSKHFFFALVEAEWQWAIRRHSVFNPYFDDGNHIVQFQSQGVRLLEDDGGVLDRVWFGLPRGIWRWADLHLQHSPLLSVTSELLHRFDQFYRPAVKAIFVGKKVLDCVGENRDILPKLQRVLTLAASYSRHRKDVVVVRFYPDWAPRSLYWEIRPSHRPDTLYLNGGIIDHSGSGYAIHT
jgi:hypothetical protein